MESLTARLSLRFFQVSGFQVLRREAPGDPGRAVRFFQHHHGAGHVVVDGAPAPVEKHDPDVGPGPDLQYDHDVHVENGRAVEDVIGCLEIRHHAHVVVVDAQERDGNGEGGRDGQRHFDAGTDERLAETDWRQVALEYAEADDELADGGAVFLQKPDIHRLEQYGEDETRDGVGAD